MNSASDPNRAKRLWGAISTDVARLEIVVALVITITLSTLVLIVAALFGLLGLIEMFAHGYRLQLLSVWLTCIGVVAVNATGLWAVPTKGRFAGIVLLLLAASDLALAKLQGQGGRDQVLNLGELKIIAGVFVMKAIAAGFLGYRKLKLSAKPE